MVVNINVKTIFMGIPLKNVMYLVFANNAEILVYYLTLSDTKILDNEMYINVLHFQVSASNREIVNPNQTIIISR